MKLRSSFMYFRFTKYRPDRWWCTYARWDGRFNNPDTRLCWKIFLFGNPQKRSVGLFLHPIWQYPFGLAGGRGCGMFTFNLRIFWIQLLVRVEREIK